MINYKIVHELDDQRWSEFVLNHPNRNPFQTPEMLTVLKNSKYYSYIFLAALDTNNNVKGILLSQLQKDYKGILGEFTARSIIWGGPLVFEDDTFLTVLLLDEYKKIAAKKAIYTQFRNLWKISNEDIYLNSGFIYEEHLNIIVDLSVTEEALWKSIKKSRKEGIRKAIRNDLVFEVVNSKENIPTFYRLLKNTFASVKKPFPKSDFFYGISEYFDNNDTKIFQLKKDATTTIIYSAFTYNNCIYAYYIGTNREHKYFVMRPIDLLYWEVMRWGINNDFKTFDWMGAGKPEVEYGVRKFKLQYGGDLIALGRYEKTHKPNLMKLGKAGLKIIQKL